MVFCQFSILHVFKLFMTDFFFRTFTGLKEKSEMLFFICKLNTSFPWDFIKLQIACLDTICSSAVTAKNMGIWTWNAFSVERIGKYVATCIKNADLHCSILGHPELSMLFYAELAYSVTTVFLGQISYL